MRSAAWGCSHHKPGDASALAPEAKDLKAGPSDGDSVSGSARRFPHSTASKRSAIGGREPLPALNGLRGVAALWVVASHLALALPAVLSSGWIRDFVHSLAIHGYLGVDIFFVVSGFVMWWNYSERLSRVTSKEYAAFIRARLARTYPVYFVFLTAWVGVVAIVADGPMRVILRPWTLIANYLMIQTWVRVESIVAIAWALSALLGMYLIFPLMVPAFRRIRSVWLRLGLILGLYLALAFAVDRAPQYGELFRVLAEFPAGCLLAGVCISLPRRPALGWVANLAFLVLAVSVATFAAGLWSPTSGLLRTDVIVGPGLLLGPTIAGLVFGLAYSGGSLARALTTRLMLMVGAVSYSLFVVQWDVLAFLNLLFRGRWPDAGLFARLGLIALYLASLAAATLASYYLVERPGRSRFGPRAVELRAVKLRPGAS
jgi:peptidoglycan/LPS O-acetylase OafA/YrhL